jgi:hypothetical protein
MILTYFSLFFSTLLAQASASTLGGTYAHDHEIAHHVYERAEDCRPSAAAGALAFAI